MKKPYQLLPSIFFLLGIINLSFAQCPIGSIEFETQQHVDDFAINFPNCTNFNGDIELNPNSTSPINNLNGLSNLDSVGGSVIIDGGHGLTNFQGWENLTYIGGDLMLEENHGIQNLQGLNGLKYVGGDFYLSEIENLISINEFESLEFVGGNFIIGDCDKLVSINNLGNLTSISGTLGIGSNDILTDLSGLFNITSVGGSVGISSNGSLKHIDALSNITSIGQNISVKYNGELENLNGLSSVASIGGYIDIWENDALQNIGGLSNLTSINGRIDIHENPSLESLEGLNNIDPEGIVSLILMNNDVLSFCGVHSVCDYITMSIGPAFVEANTFGCDTEPEIIDICSDFTSSTTLGKNEIQISPNPAQDFLEIKGISFINVQFTIFDYFGKLLHEGNLTNNRIGIEILQQGNYILKIEHSNDVAYLQFIKL